MNKWVFRSLLAVATFATVWLATIFYWRSSHRIPTTTDVALYFAFIPAALLLAFWLGHTAWKRSGEKAKENSESSTALVAASPSTGISAESERLLSIAILAAAVRSAHGKSADELNTVLKADNDLFELDTELTDEEGYPILTARITELDEDDGEDKLNDWLQANHKTDVSWSPEATRALLMGAELVSELAQTAVKHPQLAEYLSAAENKRKAIPLAALQLVTLFPKDWQEAHRTVALDWYTHLIVEAGWPIEKILTPIQSHYHLTHGITAIDQLMLSAYRTSLPCYSLLVACESYIGESSVEDWAGIEKSYFGKSKIGLIPSEGAAGLLLADEQNLKLFEHVQASKLYRPTQTKLSDTVITTETERQRLLSELLQSALEVSKVQAAHITLVTTDTDVQASKQSELLSVGFDVLPHLDSNEQFLNVSSSLGMLGGVASVTALALAHHEASTKEGKVAFISNIDQLTRAASILTPYTLLAVDS